MPLQNFVDHSTPTITASWLNKLDAFYTTLFGSATTAAAARTALGAAESGVNIDITSLNSPSIGSATATTQGVGDNTTKVATTAFVLANAGSGPTLGAGVAAFLATPTSANLRTAVTDETGSGALVFATSPTLVTPALGTPASGVATNLTGTAASLTAGTATVANGLKSATTTVSVSAATAPSVGQVLTATSTTAATWQNAAGGGVTSLNGQSGAITNTTLDAIGMYRLGVLNATNSNVNSTYAAASVFDVAYDMSNVAGIWFVKGFAFSTGTWRCVTGAQYDGFNFRYGAGLFVRIS